MTSDDDLLNSLRLRRINPADPDQIANLLRERDAELKQENANLRRKVANLEAKLAQPQSPASILATMAARNKQDYPTWTPLPEFIDQIPPGIVSASTVYRWCDAFLAWDGIEEHRPVWAIECRQPEGNSTPKEVKTASAWKLIERRAQSKGIAFTRP